MTLHCDSVLSLEDISWEHHKILDAEEKFHAFWSADDEKITMEVQVATLGWVGIGFSSNGAMPGSDIFLAWIKDDQITAHDRYANAFSTPIIDDRQDYQVLGGKENETHTTIRFSRNWNTCDENEDQDFTVKEGTLRLIWAYHAEDPDNVEYPPPHGTKNRGAKSVVLKGSGEKEFIKTSDMKSWDILRNNFEIPSHTDTTYLCEIVKVPEEILQKKHHVTAVSNYRFLSL